MSTDLVQRVSFDIIRYANCWEDADVLLAGLSPSTGSKILSVASAGDNSFSLLHTDPELVVAVDVNSTQLFLTELKKICIKNLNYGEVLEFLGFKPSVAREKTFNSLKKELGTEARSYWEKNTTILTRGVIYSGKFEKYFTAFSRKVLPFIHSKKTTEKLFLPKSSDSQERFYADKWNSWRWRLLFKIFFSKYVMGKYGRDPEFLREVKVPVSRFIYDKAAKHLSSVAAQDNFMLRFNLTGSFGDLLPHYLQKENFERIKTNIRRLKIKKGYAQDAISEFGKFNCMNLSNIFEYMDKNLFAAVAGELINGTAPGGRLAYWNLMVPRRISEIRPDKAGYLEELSASLTGRDKGFFYSKFITDKIK